MTKPMLPGRLGTPGMQLRDGMPEVSLATVRDIKAFADRVGR